MRVVIAAVLLFASGLLVNSPAHAEGGLTLRATASAADAHVVRLTGRAPSAARRVEIQQRTGGRWANLRTVVVGPRRTFHVSVRATAGTHRYRAVVGRRHSAVRTFRVAAPATKATRPGPSDACGPRPAKPDGSLWSCTFADDFDGNALDLSRWTPATNYAMGTLKTYACAIDDPSVVSVSDGHLNLSVRRIDPPLPCDAVTPGATTPYVAGTVSTLNHFSQTYGRFEARIRNTATPAVPGLHEAFWMWPVDEGGLPWPDSGEIDIIETDSIFPHKAVPRLHSAVDDPVPGVNTAWDCTAERGVWNTYTLEWSATRMAFFVNGAPCLVTNSVDPVFQKAYIPILTQALGGDYNEYDGQVSLPATMNVDYMRVWQ